MLIVEGPRLVAEALAASAVVREVYVEQAEAWPGATLVRPGTLARLGDVETSQGVLAVVDAPPLELGRPDAAHGLARRCGLGEPSRPAPVVVVLVDVADPGNAGTILRSAEAAGAAAVLFAGRCVDPTSPKVVRAAAGALFRVPVAVTADVAEALTWLDANGLRSWAAVVGGGADLYDDPIDGAVAVLFGSEAHGLPASVLDHAGMGRLSIPMAGAVESLNVAMAVTVTTFELWRRRRIGPAAPRRGSPPAE
ncbi:MAG: RNA methyltransferase [Acidimicrobiales bacterium]|nr:RNA methyltransferase [Acidimicrobiales bacterium]